MLQRGHSHSPNSVEFVTFTDIFVQRKRITIFHVFIYLMEWRRLHNEELNDLYSSPNIVRVIKSRRTRWAGHVARMDEERGMYMILVGKPE